MTIKKTFPWILIVGSIIGLVASFVLTIDTIELIKNPQADLPCNINPFLSCTSVANTWQSQIFGFPNPILGIISFSMLFAVGIMLFWGGRAKKTFWLAVNFGALLAFAFVIWFFFESVYSIGSLCIYCMIVWATTWPIFLYTTIWNFEENHFEITHPNPLLQQERASKKLQEKINRFMGFVSKNHAQILVAWYLIMVLLIIFQFKEFFFR